MRPKFEAGQVYEWKEFVNGEGSPRFAKSHPGGITARSLRDEAVVTEVMER
jgi:hypothetical protein